MAESKEEVKNLLMKVKEESGKAGLQVNRKRRSLEKAEEPEIKLPNIRWIMEKAREFQKNIYFSFIDYAKAFDCVDKNKLENCERDGSTRSPDLPLEKSVCRSGGNC